MKNLLTGNGINIEFDKNAFCPEAIRKRLIIVLSKSNSFYKSYLYSDCILEKRRAFSIGPPYSCSDLLFRVCSAEDIIHADLVVVRQDAEDVRRHHALTALIAGLDALRHVDGFSYLLLCQIRILAQVADALISEAVSRLGGGGQFSDCRPAGVRGTIHERARPGAQSVHRKRKRDVAVGCLFFRVNNKRAQGEKHCHRASLIYYSWNLM